MKAGHVDLIDRASPKSAVLDRSRPLRGARVLARVTSKRVPVFLPHPPQYLFRWATGSRKNTLNNALAFQAVASSAQNRQMRWGRLKALFLRAFRAPPRDTRPPIRYLCLRDPPGRFARQGIPTCRQSSPWTCGEALTSRSRSRILVTEQRSLRVWRGLRHCLRGGYRRKCRFGVCRSRESFSIR